MDSDTIGKIIAVTGFFGIVIGLPTWLHYRHEALKLKSKSGGAEVDALQKRIEALETKCEKLQEQVNEAHALLVDERRQLDQRLAALIQPDSQTGPSVSASPRKTIGQAN